MSRTFSLCLLLLTMYGCMTFAQIQYDTIYRKEVAPGVEHLRIRVAGAVLHTNILKVNLKDPSISIESVLANEKRFSKRETTSSMASRCDSRGHRVAGAINADFFSYGTGSPVGAHIERGEIVCGNNRAFQCVAFGNDGKIFIGAPEVSAEIISAYGNTRIQKFNDTCRAGETVMYNRFAGDTIITVRGGLHVVLRQLQNLFEDDTTLCLVDSVYVSSGTDSLAAGKVFISSAQSDEIPGKLRDRDTVRVIIQTGSGLQRTRELVGGRPVLVHNGSREALDTAVKFNTYRHPRSGIGFNADTSYMYLFAVDGRQMFSTGVSLFEFADMMIDFGVTNGLNLDGGGSTTLIAGGRIVNSPSDRTGERPCANAILIISKKPD